MVIVRGEKQGPRESKHGLFGVRILRHLTTYLMLTILIPSPTINRRNTIRRTITLRGQIPLLRNNCRLVRLLLSNRVPPLRLPIRLIRLPTILRVFKFLISRNRQYLRIALRRRFRIPNLLYRPIPFNKFNVSSRRLQRVI